MQCNYGCVCVWLELGETFTFVLRVVSSHKVVSQNEAQNPLLLLSRKLQHNQRGCVCACVREAQAQPYILHVLLCLCIFLSFCITFFFASCTQSTCSVWNRCFCIRTVRTKKIHEHTFFHQSRPWHRLLILHIDFSSFLPIGSRLGFDLFFLVTTQGCVFIWPSRTHGYHPWRWWRAFLWILSNGA